MFLGCSLEEAGSPDESRRGKERASGHADMQDHH